MQPIQITLKDIPNSEAVEAKIRQKANKLAQFYNHHLDFCKIVINLAQNSKHQGKLFNAHLEVGIPGKVLVVNRKMDEDLYIVLRDAFHAMLRQLGQHKMRQRGFVKNHSEMLYGKIARLYSGYGFIESSDGREFYFDRIHMLTDFDALQEGDVVEFIEGAVGESLQATHVNLIKNSVH
jgi:ribosomal subunit interface protein